MRIGLGIKLTTPQRPAGGVGGGAQTVWNTADQEAGAFTVTNAGLTATRTGAASSTWTSMRATTFRSTGKRYFEFHYDTPINTFSPMVGVMAATSPLGNYPGADAHGAGQVSQGNVFATGGTQANGGTYIINDVMGVAVDLDAGTTTFYKNNVVNGSVTGWVLGNVTPTVCANTADAGAKGTLRTKSAQFTFTPPSGYLGWDD